MNASAYLQKQGWRGDGHSLDHTDRGIKKPLLVSKKVDVLGVGLNKHQAVSDQWWLRAFDQGLKTFGTGQESALGKVQKHGVNRGGLYARFVQGDGVPGSIGQSPVPGSEAGTGTNTPTELQRKDEARTMPMLPESEGVTASARKSKKRKRDEDPEEKRARRKKERKDRSKESKRKHERAAEEECRPSKAERRQRRVKKQISRQADEFVLEAQQRGYISINPMDDDTTSAEPGPTSEPGEAFKSIIARAGLALHTTSHNSADQLGKAQKHSREKMKREVKRAAKAYLASTEPLAKSNAQAGKSKKAERKALEAQTDKMDVCGQQADKKSRSREAKEKRAPAEIKSTEDDIDAPEGKLGVISREGQKSIPDVGPVGRYPTSSEKMVKQAAANSKVETKHLSPMKLGEYAARAERKGMSVEDYIRRRESKHAAKRGKSPAG